MESGRPDGSDGEPRGAPFGRSGTKPHIGFGTGPIGINELLIGTTEHDIFSLDPRHCPENWRTHVDDKPTSLLAFNRGAAPLDGLFCHCTRGGRMHVYDFNSGQRVWEAMVAEAELGESTPTAPIVWTSRVFIGNAGGDENDVKARMFVLDAKTGKAVLHNMRPGGP